MLITSWRAPFLVGTMRQCKHVLIDGLPCFVTEANWLCEVSIKHIAHLHHRASLQATDAVFLCQVLIQHRFEDGNLHFLHKGRERWNQIQPTRCQLEFFVGKQYLCMPFYYVIDACKRTTDIVPIPVGLMTCYSHVEKGQRCIRICYHAAKLRRKIDIVLSNSDYLRSIIDFFN